jgi:hypothetical protein
MLPVTPQYLSPSLSAATAHCFDKFFLVLSQHFFFSLFQSCHTCECELEMEIGREKRRKGFKKGEGERQIIVR